jgi:glycine/D-amino acid oxidase-like deaminating enzyme/nitrite reductase/ring-hydroxylating ferredoxin subunit
MHSTGSIWERPASLRNFRPLDADSVVDVAVVGGGITGLTTALLLAEAGKRVALLESRHLGAGVTGSTTAHVTEAIDTRYHELESKFGREGAQLVRASSRDAMETIARLASGADCGLERLNGYLFTDDEAQIAELDAEFSAAERAGASVERCRAPLPFPSRAGLCFADQLQLRPLEYLGALVTRLGQTSAKLFEGTAMLDITTRGGLSVIATDNGPTVTTEAVVLATHAPFANLTLQLELAQYRSYVVAGRVASAPAGLFWDMEDPYHYVRHVSQGGQSYLVIGGEDHRTGTAPEFGDDAPFGDLEAYAARFGVQPEARWSAQVVESADGLPFIGKADPNQNLYVATGFGGNGTTFGTLAAMLISDSILGRDNPYAELYRANRFKPLAALRAVVSENLETAAHLVSGHLKPVSHAPLSELPIGVGRIVSHDGKRLAVYRDQDGGLHAVSAICTHQGCQVAFNPRERSWDCPCHGSRFDLEGRVLDGPATKPLAKQSI